MKRIGIFIGFLALVAFVMPGLTAQDAKKKDAEKTDKKEEAKKDLKDEKKDPDKKDDEKKKKEPEPKKEKLVYGQKFFTKVISIKPDSNREFTIQVYEPDPKKIFDHNNWKNTRLQQLAQQQFQANRQTDFNARRNQFAQYQKDLYNFNVEVAKRSNNLTTAKNVDVFGGDNAKVRSLSPRIEFDDTGNIKKLTAKEKEALKDKTGLPGYPSEFDAIKPGHFIEIYMVKPAAKKKEGKKKGPDDDDPMPMMRHEYLMVVIQPEAK